MRTVEREQYIAERARAATDATWEVITEMGDRIFSYQDVTIEVSARLHALGFDWFGDGYGTRNTTEPLIRAMARAGILVKVRAFDPPSTPHLFRVAP